MASPFAKNSVWNPPASDAPFGTHAGALPTSAEFPQPVHVPPPPPGAEVPLPDLPASMMVSHIKDWFSSPVSYAAANVLPLELLSQERVASKVSDLFELGKEMTEDAAALLRAAQESFDSMNAPVELRSGTDFM